VLLGIEKEATPERARETFALCKKYGIDTHAYIMLNTPWETRETLKETERFIEEIKPTSVAINITIPLLGTALYDYCVEHGLLNLESYDEYDYLLRRDGKDAGPIKNPNLTFLEVIETKNRILRKRRLKVWWYNLKQLFSDVVRERDLRKVFYRWKTYKRIKHFFG
jgi:radical SAM superfamily enzyme YgiQ (UPF0313 family)